MFGPMSRRSGSTLLTQRQGTSELIPLGRLAICASRVDALESRQLLTVTFADGLESEDAVYATIEHPHHTSIVSKNTGAGELTVLEQNDKGHHERVRSTVIRWKDAPTKETSTRKSMKRSDTGKMDLATVKVTVDVSVTGTITAYRPKAP